MQYFPDPNPPDRERVERLVLRQLEHWQTHGYGWWAVAWPADGRLLGWCGFQYLPDTAEVEVGYLLAHAVWGQGLATEAATAAVDFGFTHFPLAEIIGITHPANLASQRVLEKAGLTFTAATRYFTMSCYRFARPRVGSGACTCADAFGRWRAGVDDIHLDRKATHRHCAAFVYMFILVFVLGVCKRSTSQSLEL